MKPSKFVAAYTASCPGWQYAYCCQNVMSYRRTTVSKEENRKEMKIERKKNVKLDEKVEE